MPLALERKLARVARARGYGKRRTAAYVWGTLRKTGWRPKRRGR